MDVEASDAESVSEISSETHSSTSCSDHSLTSNRLTDDGEFESPTN